MLSTLPETAKRITSDTNSLLLDRLGAARAERVLDVGCGSGETCRYLATLGIETLGIDPFAAAIEAARAAAPDLAFEILSATDLTAEQGVFDAAVCVNALHHIAEAEMVPALKGVTDRLRPEGGLLIVIEPLTEGNFFRAMLPVEDETEIRAQAVAAVGAFAAKTSASLIEALRWDRISYFADLEAFVDRLSAVEPERRAMVAANRVEVEAAWAREAKPTPQGYELTQPIMCWIFRR